MIDSPRAKGIHREIERHAEGEREREIHLEWKRRVEKRSAFFYLSIDEEFSSGGTLAFYFLFPLPLFPCITLSYVISSDLALSFLRGLSRHLKRVTPILFYDLLLGQPPPRGIIVLWPIYLKSEGAFLESGK